MSTARKAALCAAFVLSGCSLSIDPGSVSPPSPSGRATGTFTKTFVAGLTSGNAFPFSGVYEMKHQMLYTAAEVGGAGRISAIRFQRWVTTAAAVTCPNVSVRFGHTGVSALGATFASNVNLGSIATALADASVTIAAGAAGTWFEIPLATPFEYDGVGDLVVEIETNTPCTANVASSYSSAAGIVRAVARTTDTDPSTPQHSEVTADITDATHLWMQFVFAGGDDFLAYAGTTAATNTWPLATQGGGLRIQSLHLASDIAGSGPVTGLGFQLSGTSAAGTYTYTVKMGHSNAPLTMTYDSNFAGAPVTVASNVTFSVPAGMPAGSWVWIPIPNGVFTYNGTDDLLVEVATASGTGSNQPFRVGSRAGARVAANGSTAATGQAIDGALYHLALRFNGAPVYRTAPVSNATSSQVLGSGMSGQIQGLYDAVRLGTGGSIGRVAVRLNGASAATTVPNVKIYMGQTTKTSLALADSYASNMDNQTLVYSGPLTIPAGLAPGDWLPIPLGTSFAYDGVKNLVVLFTADQAGALNGVRGQYDVTAFPSHSVGWNNNTGDTSATPNWTWDGLLDLRLGIQR